MDVCYLLRIDSCAKSYLYSVANADDDVVDGCLVITKMRTLGKRTLLK